MPKKSKRNSVKRKSVKRKSKSKRKRESYQNRFVISAKEIESEFEKTGLKVEHQIDFMPYYSMWRTYVLRKV